MKYLIKVFFIFFYTLLLVGCGQHQIKGSGKVTTETRVLANFSQLQAAGDVHLLIKVGETQGVIVTVDDNLQPYVLTTVEKGRLKIYIKKGYWIVPSTPIQIKITLSKLHSMALEGTVIANVTGLSGHHFDLHCAGATNVILQGKVTKTSIGILGTATVDGKNLLADWVSLDVAGSATASIFAGKKMNVKISGAGRVTYYGEPVIIHQAIFGAGQITKGK